MGILTRRQGDAFLISSDRDAAGHESKRPPRRMNDDFQVWAGDSWSADIDEAVLFESLEEADEYVRVNYSKLSASS